MISIEFVFLFMAFSIPLVCTPGPGNIILAMSGAQQGVIGTIPLIVGIDLTYIIFTVLIGLGLGELFMSFPVAHMMLKYGGCLYLFYLAYKIWNSITVADNSITKPLGFKDGVILTIFNPKAHLLMILMFSQFMKPDGRIIAQVTLLTAALAFVNIPNHFIWSYLGEFIARRLETMQNGRKSNKAFSIMLVCVAIYILIS